jgi:amino acid transporter
MSVIIRNRIPEAILFIVGILMIVDFFVITPESYSNFVNDIQNVAVIISAFALGLGAASLLRYNFRTITERREGWPFSIWLLLMMVIFAFVGLTYGTTSEAYQWLYSNFYVQIYQTMYSLLGFFLVYACYRTFQARNWEVAIMLIFCIFTMMNRAPIGVIVWSGLPNLVGWINKLFNVPGNRAWILVRAIGIITIGLRTLIGRERSALAGGT